MDRNQAVGLFLISALLIVYMFFFSPNKEKEKTAEPAKTTAITGKDQVVPPANAPLDSAAQARQAQAMGSFGAAAVGTVQNQVLENNKLKVTFTSKGGAVEEVLLKNFKTFDKEADALE